MSGLPPFVRLPAAVGLVAACLAAAISWFGTAGWEPASVRATADVNIAPLIGTYSNFEVATHAADFASAYGDERTSGDVAGDPDAAGAFVDASRVGNGTIIEVTFVAPTQAEAEEGLKRQVRHALEEVANGIEEQLDAELEGAELAKDSLQEEAEDGSTTGGAAAVNRAQEIVADTSTSLRSIQVAKQRIGTRVAALRVDTEPMSTTSTRVRASLASGLAALVVAAAAVWIVRRRQHPGP